MAHYGGGCQVDINKRSDQFNWRMEVSFITKAEQVEIGPISDQFGASYSIRSEEFVMNTSE